MRAALDVVNIRNNWVFGFLRFLRFWFFEVLGFRVLGFGFWVLGFFCFHPYWWSKSLPGLSNRCDTLNLNFIRTFFFIHLLVIKSEPDSF